MDAWEKKYWATVKANKEPGSSRAGQQGVTLPLPRSALKGAERVPAVVGRGVLREPTSTPVRVREGLRFYRILQTGGFAQGSVPLVREEGAVTADMASREYVTRGECLGYPVEMGTLVNMAYVSPESPRVRKFIVLETPFVGRILIEDVPPQTVLKG